ncbi:MAG: hypothetical protein GY765_39390, partial [bacterium]|nr:hypothetical protein [bacterium]
MDMMEKVKQFIAAFASLTAVLYASGYLVEYAHDRMLGISVLKFTKEDLLISGGRFVLANLYELYTSFFPNFLFFLVFVVLVVFILKLEKANGDQLSGPYFLFLFLLLAGFLSGPVPYFMLPFGIADLLHGV